MHEKTDPDRRRFLRRAAVTIATIPVASLVLHPQRRALADKPEAEDGHAHHYVNDAADADHDNYEEGELCENCAFWAGEERNGWGGCHHPDFQDVLVNADGWCSVYARG